MKADFLDAHQRHWDDAEHLFQVGRWANADHLYGIAAECGLKRLMLAFGMSFDATKDRPTERDDRVHANGVWDRFESYRKGYAQGADYALPVSNPFDNWDVSDRYGPQSHFTQPLAQTHQAGAQTVQQLIKKAQIVGLL
jgi:hypothetical protein